ncbi:MAG: 50S ribosomal protein L4 [Candidatus Omnitrophica bacterium]|nr:50S ribosomal protein L4 [Candidatus Omnitrophota bacterium]
MKTKPGANIKPKSADGMNKIQLFDSAGKKKETIELDKDVFNGKYSNALLYQSVNIYRSNTRQGTSSTKTRADVSGGGKKPWKQKGTGRARVGSIRNPLWRGGGIAFGPHPRDFRREMPKKMKKSAFLSSINAKLRSGRILAIENIKLDAPKTRKIAELLNALKVNETALLLVDDMDKNLVLATRNLRDIKLKRVADATALDVLSSEQVILTRGAAQQLNKRFNDK